MQDMLKMKLIESEAKLQEFVLESELESCAVIGCVVQSTANLQGNQHSRGKENFNHDFPVKP